MVVFHIGPEYVTSVDTGATMADLCATLFCIVLGFSFFLPFLTDCGIMEFLGVLLKPVVRPLFRVPGRASIDLIASWFGASNAAVILTREQYMKGFYTKREAGYIMTNFSIVSIPFCLLIANTVNISHLFPSFYLCICVVGVLLAVIIARIPPISLLPDTYQERTGKQLNEDVPQQTGLFHYALESSCKRAESFRLKNVVSGGMEVLMGMYFDLIPIVISWGTIVLMIATYTPLFKWISYPMGMYLSLFGLEEAFAALPVHPASFCKVCTIDLKRNEPGLLNFCSAYGLELETFSAAQLGAVTGEFSASEFVEQVTGVDNVCERAAVLGSSGTLCLKKRAMGGVTMAVAAKPFTPDWRWQDE